MAKRNKKKKRHRVFWFFVKVQIALMFLVAIGVGYYYLGGYAEIIKELKTEAHNIVAASDESIFVPSQTVYVYDCNGDLISMKKGSVEADYVYYEDIPSVYVDAIISIEDKKFYSHNGVDFKGILRAGKAMVQNLQVTQGGSTITMQLAKLIYMDSGRDWKYKIEQMDIAMELEKIYSKNKIMEFYLNNIYFANGYYGIQSACKGYFDCDLAELSVSEVAFLLAIPNSPTYYDPLTNYDNTMERRDKILKAMRDDGKISEAVYQNSLKEEVVLNPAEDAAGLWNNYVDTYTYYCATRALMQEAGFEFQYYFDSEEEEQDYYEQYDEVFAQYQKQLFTKGYAIYTSIDMQSQQALQAAIDENLMDFTDTNEEGTYDMQASGVCIDNETGLVTAIVGGRSQNYSVYTLNRAYQSHRQPGSSIKPLLVYAPSFDLGLYEPTSMVNDQELEDGPKNAGEYYWGEVTLSFAVAKSLNTVAWQIYDEITPSIGLGYLKDMNFTAISENDYVLATSLGGFTNGASALEMAAGYATLCNDGLYRQPTDVVRIVDAEKNIVYEREALEVVIYGETASRMMTACLQGVFLEGGTANGLALNGDMPCAGKTGTTNDKKDGWFVGYTRYYTTAIWVGCDMPKAVEGLAGSTYPGAIWNQYMNEIHENLEPLNFLPYAQLSEEFFMTDSDGDGIPDEEDEDANGNIIPDVDEEGQPENAEGPERAPTGEEPQEAPGELPQEAPQDAPAEGQPEQPAEVPQEVPGNDLGPANAGE